MTELPTYETACICPKCSLPGQVVKKMVPDKVANLPQGTMIHMIYCRTEYCKWFNTPWTVQVNRDGSIPAPKDHKGGPKLYQGFGGHDEEAIRIVESLKRNAIAETKPGGMETR